MPARFFSLRVFSICLGVAAGLLLGFEGGSAQAASKGQQASKSRTGAAPRVVIGGTSVSQTIFAYDDPNSLVGSSEAYATFPGMIVTVTLAKKQLLLATFGAESACYGGDVGSPDWCAVRILANTTALQPCVAPADCTDFAFTSTDNGAATAASWRQHQMTRGRILEQGTYTIRVQGRVKRFGTAIPTFWTGERTLVVQVIEP